MNIKHHTQPFPQDTERKDVSKSPRVVNSGSTWGNLFSLRHHQWEFYHELMSII